MNREPFTIHCLTPSPTDSPLVAVENFDRDTARAGELVAEAIGPFDCQDAAVQFLESEIVGGRLFEAVEIDVIQRESSAPVLMDQRERRTADILCIDAKPLGQSPHERRFSRAQIPRKQDHVSSEKSCGQSAGNGRGFCF